MRGTRIKLLPHATLALVVLAASAAPSFATDIQVNPTGPVFSFPTLAWGNTSSTSLGFNNNFFFTPLSQNESVCVFVSNNNPTNAHGFTVSITINSNPKNVTPSDGTWITLSQTGGGSFAPISPSPASGIGGQINGAALVSINLSASITQTGSPDTASVQIVQTSGSCSSFQNFSGSSSGISAGFPTSLQFVSDSITQGFGHTSTTTNPIANQVVEWVSANGNTSRSLYFDSITVSSTAAVTLTVQAGANAGTCATGTLIYNLKLIGSGSSVLSSGSAGPSCTVTPTLLATLGVINLPANGSFTLDLKGTIAVIGAFNSVFVQSTAATGNISATLKWYER